ncbi:conserved exported hypothetical protein [Desulfamplus magnetovallimortis]|uniref:Uncharacterized protein n=1 Tax=Desulfamplus magnetovallimortis TaxID=1246637 RepID=A0A1W1HL17_9BACT|nr:hypothetical protein [Desulfamplus magnetovallimortis]SLM33169.1 conserved exported hypothetical protein [Desulfamplus magnetovallimortis]
MKFNVINFTMVVLISLYLFFPLSSFAVEPAPRISDREIIEKLSKLEVGQEALSTRLTDIRDEMKSGQETLRAEMKSGMEALGKRLDDLSARQADANDTMLVLFSSLIALIVALFGYILWDRRTMMKPVSEKLHQFEREVRTNLELNHSEGSLLKRQLQVMKKYAEKNPEFADIMRGEALI